LSADPGKYKGPVIDFEKVAEELEEEEPKWTKAKKRTQSFTGSRG
jgi:hypothetical protein